MKSVLMLLFTSTMILLAAETFASPTPRASEISLAELTERLPENSRLQFLQRLDEQNIDFKVVSDLRIQFDENGSRLRIEGAQGRHTSKDLFYIGAQLGSLWPIGLQVLQSHSRDGRPLWDADVQWEPSHFIQSYSAGGAIHPLRNSWVVGARVRGLQLQSAKSPAFDPAVDYQVGISGESGFRAQFGKSQKILGSLIINATYVPTQEISLPVMYNVNVTVGYRIKK